MSSGADAFGTLGWGLKRYAWLVAVFVIGIGVLLPVLLARNADVYETRAQVGPTGALALPNLDALPRLGESVFANGAVEGAVRRRLELPETTEIIPARAELVTAVDNIVFTVVGRGPDAESAKRSADSAAATFTLELNKYTTSVGQFEIQRAADLAAEPLARWEGPLAIVLGVVAGIVAGVGAVALLLAWRRPVVDAATAADITGVPALGTVHLARDPRHSVGVAPLCRRLLASRADIILLSSTTKATSERRELGSAMERMLSGARQVRLLSGGTGAARALVSQPTSDDRSSRPELVIVDGPTMDAVATRPDSSFTVLVAEQGIGLAALRRSAEQYLDGGPAGIVLVEPAGWRSRRRPNVGHSKGRVSHAKSAASSHDKPASAVNKAAAVSRSEPPVAASSDSRNAAPPASLSTPDGPDDSDIERYDRASLS